MITWVALMVIAYAAVAVTYVWQMIVTRVGADVRWLDVVVTIYFSFSTWWFSWLTKRCYQVNKRRRLVR